ncbi:hypothetical protein BpHYR1_010152 [Brachionus plicatilis]|uniref:Uncharacterized protein n=1 Tax=Brachionus plicatilis TaxID=10195 RepID=A0A3M7PV66_BRAPC|nr:hypothetical protein BpHYR1_010152 [Brachionus plicatilis]
MCLIVHSALGSECWCLNQVLYLVDLPNSTEIENLSFKSFIGADQIVKDITFDLIMLTILINPCSVISEKTRLLILYKSVSILSFTS